MSSISSLLKEVRVSDFGSVHIPIIINDDGKWRSVIKFNNEDLSHLLECLSWHYPSYSKSTQRQREIRELSKRLSDLLKKEKKLEGVVSSPLARP